MMSEETIVQRLEEKGLKSGEARATMQEVGKLIVARVAVAYLDMLSEEDREHIKSLPEEEVPGYLASKQGELPQMTQEQFDTIHDSTWEEYFSETTKGSPL